MTPEKGERLGETQVRSRLDGTKPTVLTKNALVPASVLLAAVVLAWTTSASATRVQETVKAMGVKVDANRASIDGLKASFDAHSQIGWCDKDMKTWAGALKELNPELTVPPVYDGK